MQKNTIHHIYGKNEDVPNRKTCKVARIRNKKKKKKKCETNEQENGSSNTENISTNSKDLSYDKEVRRKTTRRGENLNND